LDVRKREQGGTAWLQLRYPGKSCALIDPAINNLSAEEIYARLLLRNSEGTGEVQQ
jgi:hypothetical protein